MIALRIRDIGSIHKVGTHVLRGTLINKNFLSCKGALCLIICEKWGGGKYIYEREFSNMDILVDSITIR